MYIHISIHIHLYLCICIYTPQIRTYQLSVVFYKEYVYACMCLYTQHVPKLCMLMFPPVFGLWP